MVNFYRRFLPKIAQTLAPLTNLSEGKTLPKLLPWEERHDVGGRGELLHLGPRAAGRPLTISCRRLKEGSFSSGPTTKPLVAAMTRVTPPGSGWQQRHLAFIAEHTCDVRHTPGVDNVVADTLLLYPLDLKEMALQQILCQQVQQLLHAPGLWISFKQVGDLKLWGVVSTGTFRPLVPLPHRRQVFDHLHQLAHSGLRATCRIISFRYVWRGLARDVTAWARECLNCQRGKVHCHVQLRPVHVMVSERRFSHIPVDLVRPLPAQEGATYVFTVIDRNTRWFQALPLADISAKTCAFVLTHGWIARYGVPAVITSDRGSQFTSALWDSICNILGIRHVQTTAYHPQSNGLVEQFYRRLKDALWARLANPMWTAHLPWVLLGLRAAPLEEDNISPAQAVFGTPIDLPGQFLDENANVNEN
jgi:Integrase core domain/Integrase zinc binding domain